MAFPFQHTKGSQATEVSTQPAACRPARVPPMVTDRLAIESTILVEATDERPPIVLNTLEEGFRGVLGILEDILEVTAEPMAGIAQ